MIKIIDQVLPLGTSKSKIASHSTNDNDRQGAVETMYHIIEQLGTQVLPWLIFLMAPLLSRMSDQNESIRFISTNAFAQLVCCSLN